jgi:hypothetical protein
MTAIDNDNTYDVMISTKGIDQELKSAANAAGNMFIETITDGG